MSTIDTLLKKSLNGKIQEIDEEFKKAIIVACEKAYQKYNYKEKIEFDDMERWGFETQIWSIGENLRKFLLNQKSLAYDQKLIEIITEVIKVKKYRTGRQSFVLLVEDFKIAEVSNFLSLYIEDDFIGGHVISALLKIKNFNYCNEIGKVLSKNPSGWIKQKCKKYLAFCNA